MRADKSNTILSLYTQHPAYRHQHFQFIIENHAHHTQPLPSGTEGYVICNPGMFGGLHFKVRKATRGYHTDYAINCLNNGNGKPVQPNMFKLLSNDSFQG